MIQSKFAWKNGWQERERKKEKLLLEKKTVRKCRGCLTCVQQFVTIWFAMDWLNYTVGWQNLTYTKEGPSLQVLFSLSCQWTEVSFTRFFPRFSKRLDESQLCAVCKKINPNIQLLLFHWSTFKSGLIFMHWHDEKKRLLTWLFFRTNKMMMSSSWNPYHCASFILLFNT